ncbi:MAG: polyprenol phosphomannose-dependent alpha 1,6 mannosyltransferase MptB [Acidimicrobiales bacterium]
MPAPVSLLACGVVGGIGSLCVLLGVVQHGSPFTLKATGAWFFGTAPISASGVSENYHFLGIMLTYLGVALMLGSWWELVRMVRKCPGTPLRQLVAILVAWAAPIIVAPPLFSRDVYSYAAQGQMVAQGINPYLHGPTALRSGAFLSLVDPLWRSSTAPYGPAWERLSGWIVQLSGHDVRSAIVGFRAFALAGVVLVAWAVPVLARSLRRNVPGAFALAVLNPLVILDLLGGSHNDALMLGLLVAACAAARRRHVIAGLTLCALAAEVKIPALVGAAFIGWWWAGPVSSWRERLARAAGAVSIAAGLMAAIAALSALGWRWFSGLSNPGAVVSWLDPATAVGLLIARSASFFGYAGHQAVFVQSARAVALGVATVVAIFLLVRSERIGEVQAIGWSLLAFVFLGPVVWPWYESWGFVFLAVVAEKWTLRFMMVLSVVACLADVPSPSLLISANSILVSACWVLLLGMCLLFAVTRVAPRARMVRVTSDERPGIDAAMRCGGTS